jgi:predicted nucleotidyltransferase
MIRELENINSKINIAIAISEEEDVLKLLKIISNDLKDLIEKYIDDGK